MKREIRQAESDRRTGSTPLLRLMRRLGIPVTRQSYLDIDYFGEPPETLSPEQEADLHRVPHRRPALRRRPQLSPGGVPLKSSKCVGFDFRCTAADIAATSTASVTLLADTDDDACEEPAAKSHYRRGQAMVLWP
jgi:hypothetical protein